MCALLFAMGLAVPSASLAWGGLALAGALAFSIATVPVPRLIVRRSVSASRLAEGDVLREDIEVSVARGRAWIAVKESSTRGLQGAASGFEGIVRAGAPERRTVSWKAHEWGLQRLGPASAHARDLLRLVEVDVADDAPIEVHVTPRPQPLGKFASRSNLPQPSLGAHSVTRPGDGSEFFALREYQPGDSVRRINWKASARSKSMVVNQTTRETFARVLVIVDLRAKEEWGAAGVVARVRNGRAAASILAHHDRAKDSLTLLALGDEAKRLSLAANPRLDELLKAMTQASIGGAVRLDECVQRHLALLRPRSPSYLLTSAITDAELVPAVRRMLATGTRLTIVSPVPAVDPSDAESTRIALASRRKALRTLRGLGVRVLSWAQDVPLEVAMLAA